MRLLAYTRVSTDRQAEEGFGLEVQEQSVRRWARAQGHRLVRVVREEGVSGTLADRPGLAEMFAALKAGEAVGVVVPRLDRLARDLIVQESLLAEIWRGGWQVHSALASEAHYLTRDGDDDPSRTLIRHVLGAVAQHERSTIKLRLAAGRRRKGDTGGYAYGAPPLGFRAEGGELVPDDREAAVLARMRELRDAGASLRQIGSTLTAEGHHPKRGSVWHPASIARVLNRDAGRPVRRTYPHQTR